MTNLDAKERDRFAEWLAQEAAMNEAMAKQLETLGPAHAVGVRKFRLEAMAATIIARKLRNTEEVSL